MTFEEIAAELGVDERTARRTVAAVLEKLRASLSDAADPDLVVRVLVLVLTERDFSSSDKPSFSRVARRFSNNRVEPQRHARRLPARFPRKP